MKQFARSNLGVTLLEIMLVLAIASMVIVMSIRYYQSASSNQQATNAIQGIQGIIAAMDNLGMNGGYTNVTTADLTSVVGANNMRTPTNALYTVTGNTATTYVLTAPLNGTICPNVMAKLRNNAKITVPDCSATGTLTFTYDSTR